MPEHASEVLDLHVRALHRAHRVLAAHELGHDRVDGRLLLLLVLHEPFEQEPPDLFELGHRLLGRVASRGGRRRSGSAGRCGANSWCSARKRSPTFDARPAALPRLAIGAERPERVQDHGDVDRLLHDRAADRQQQPERAEQHPDERQPHARSATLWTAIPRERRAIRIASATRSSRSTTRTTSAASDDAVAPRAPIATPTSAAASAGASFTPSPTMIVRPNSRLRPHGIHLVGRVALGQDPVDADRDPDGLGDVRVIAGDHHDAFDARRGGASGSPSACRGGSGPRAPTRRRSARRSRSITHDEPSIALRRRTSRAGAGNGYAVRDPRGLAERHAAVLDRPSDPGRRAPRSRPWGTRARARDDARRSRSPSRARAARPGRATPRAAAPRRARDRRTPSISATSGVPVVSVPVLSNSRTRPRASASSAPPPLTMMPRFAAREIPATIAIGAASSSGHGVATTSTDERPHRVAR